MHSMVFILGYFVGLLNAILVFAILAFFRAGIEKRVKIIETRLGSAGPKTTGAVFMPEDDATLSRNEYIAKNKKAGRDIPIAELQEEE